MKKLLLAVAVSTLYGFAASAHPNNPKPKPKPQPGTHFHRQVLPDTTHGQWIAADCVMFAWGKDYSSKDLKCKGSQLPIDEMLRAIHADGLFPDGMAAKYYCKWHGFDESWTSSRSVAKGMEQPVVMIRYNVTLNAYDFIKHPNRTGNESLLDKTTCTTEHDNGDHTH